MGVIPPVAHDADAYQAMQLQLLPPGRAWSRDPGSFLGKLFGAFADALARLEARALQLLDEADPSTATELLGDWERVVGLPDRCVPIADTLAGRRQAVVRKLVSQGGLSKPFFEGLATHLGLAAEILECAPFQIGSSVGDLLYDDRWRFFFEVAVAGDAPDAATQAMLACVVGSAAPAGSNVLISYDNEA